MTSVAIYSYIQTVSVGPFRECNLKLVSITELISASISGWLSLKYSEMGADVSNILYPDDPMRRQKALVLSQMIFVALSSNFRAVNHLSDFLKRELLLKNVSTNLTSLKMDRSETIKHNCEVLQSRIEEIQEIISEMDTIFQNRLETELYLKLIHAHTEFSDTLVPAKQALDKLSDVVQSSGGIAVIATVGHKRILKHLISALKAMGNSFVAETVVSVVLEFLVL